MDYATLDGTAVDGSDYTAVSGTLTWADGDSTGKTFTVPITTDDNVEGDETVNIAISNATGGAVLASPNTAVLTIIDYEEGCISLTSADYIVAEDVVSAMITATRTQGSDGAVGVDYETSDGTATDGSDFTATTGTLSWADGDLTSKTFTISIIDDVEVEGDETVNITLTRRTRGVRYCIPWIAELTITDNDVVQGNIALTTTTYSVSEDGITATITAIRTGGSSGAVTVDYNTSDGTATAGSDYTAASGTLSWADGDSADKTFDINIIDDALIEGDETVNIAISNPTGGAILGSPNSAVLTIIDVEEGTIALTSATYSVSEVGVWATITATRTNGSSGAVTVDFNTSDGTATAGSDYTAASGTLSWGDGDSADKTFNITIIDDVLIEGDETVNIAISNPTGGAILGSPNSAVLTITDVEEGAIALTSATYSVSEVGVWATITATRTNGSSGAVTVDFNTSDGTATAGSDYTAASGTLSWADGDSADKTFDINIIDDVLIEGDETVNIAISNPAGGASLGTPNAALLTITDNE